MRGPESSIRRNRLDAVRDLAIGDGIIRRVQRDLDPLDAAGLFYRD